MMMLRASRNLPKNVFAVARPGGIRQYYFQEGRSGPKEKRGLLFRLPDDPTSHEFLEGGPSSSPHNGLVQGAGDTAPIESKGGFQTAPAPAEPCPTENIETGEHTQRQLQWMWNQVANYPEKHAGARSALFDAAHLCDAIAADIENGGRKSKRRSAEAAAVRRAGDTIWTFYELIGPPPTPSTSAGGR